MPCQTVPFQSMFMVAPFRAAHSGGMPLLVKVAIRCWQMGTPGQQSVETVSGSDDDSDGSDGRKDDEDDGDADAEGEDDGGDDDRDADGTAEGNADERLEGDSDTPAGSDGDADADTDEGDAEEGDTDEGDAEEGDTDEGDADADTDDDDDTDDDGKEDDEEKGDADGDGPGDGDENAPLPTQQMNDVASRGKVPSRPVYEPTTRPRTQEAPRAMPLGSQTQTGSRSRSFGTAPGDCCIRAG
jgi:hypothetical protein